MKMIAKQRNQAMRDRCSVRLSGWRADQLIFLDESAACERTGRDLLWSMVTSLIYLGDRRYGWAPPRSDAGGETVLKEVKEAERLTCVYNSWLPSTCLRTVPFFC